MLPFNKAFPPAGSRSTESKAFMPAAEKPNSFCIFFFRGGVHRPVIHSSGLAGRDPVGGQEKDYRR